MVLIFEAEMVMPYIRGLILFGKENRRKIEGKETIVGTG